ncbi:hypothetical protein LINGRAHAP2_LOCUS24993 [Linum grandiflorum]
MEPWIPSSDAAIPLPRPLTLSIPSRVSDFITQTGNWNSELLSTYFCPSSVTTILSIPLPQTWVPDRFVWSHSSSGEFSAASGYRFARMSIDSTQILKAGPDIRDSRLWAKIWSLPIQPKLRFFLWKIIYGILPTSDALSQRGVDVDSRCPVCLTSPETLSHLFFSCIISQSLAFSLGCDNFTGIDKHLVSFLRSLLETDLYMAAKLTYFWWRLWKSWNIVLFENYQYTVDVLRRQFLHQWTEGIKAFTPLPPPNSSPVSHLATSRSQVSTDWVILVDAAVREDPSEISASFGALGFVVRRRCGSLALATGQVIHHIWDPFILEMLVVRQALFVAQVRP